MVDVFKLMKDKDKGGLRGYIGSLLSELYDVYKKSLITIPFEVYITWAYRATLITFVILTGVLTFILHKYVLQRVPLYGIFILSIFIAATLSLIVLLGFVYYPYYVTKARGDVIRSKLIYTISYMTAVAAAGVIPERIFERVAEIEPTKEIRREALRILRDIRMLGYDTLTALKNRIDAAPNPLLQDFYAGLRNVILTSGSVREYLLFYLRRLFKERSEELARVTSSLATLSEIYVTLMVAGPIIALIALTVMQMIWPGAKIMGIPLGIIMLLLLFVVIPLSAVIMLIIVDAIISRV